MFFKIPKPAEGAPSSGTGGVLPVVERQSGSSVVSLSNGAAEACHGTEGKAEPVERAKGWWSGSVAGLLIAAIRIGGF